MNEIVQHHLMEAHEDNAKLTQLMNTMGINPRPTIAEWIRQKNEQKKNTMREALIDWDNDENARETAIVIQQAIVSQRAMKHAAWGAKKDINSKLSVLKTTPLSKSKRQLPPLHGSKQSKSVIMPMRNRAVIQLTTPSKRLKIPTAFRASSGLKATDKVAPTSSERTGLELGHLLTHPLSGSDFACATPAGFFKVHGTSASASAVASKPRTDSEYCRKQQRLEEMWQMGQNYSEYNQAYNICSSRSGSKGVLGRVLT